MSGVTFNPNPIQTMSTEQVRLIRQDAQNIVDVALARLREEPFIDADVRHDLEQIVFSAKRLHQLTGERAIDPDEPKMSVIVAVAKCVACGSPYHEDCGQQ